MLNVDKLIKKYRKSHPDAGRKELYTIIRLEYEKYCIERHIYDKNAKDAFLKKLERKLDAYESLEPFPEPSAKRKKAKTEEETLYEFIKERYPHGVRFYSQTKYRPTFNETEEELKDGATLSENDYLDPRFRKKFARLKKKWLEEHIKT